MGRSIEANALVARGVPVRLLGLQMEALLSQGALPELVTRSVRETTPARSRHGSREISAGRPPARPRPGKTRRTGPPDAHLEMLAAIALSCL